MYPLRAFAPVIHTRDIKTLPHKRGATRHSREIELLLLGARRYVDNETRAHIARLTEPSLDWSWLLAQAQRHGVTSLLYFNLRSVTTAAPDSAMDALATMFRTCAKHNLYLLGQLLTILDEFERRQIAVVPFKGPMLAVTAFADVSLREFGDLDLLIHECDIGRAHGALVELGFRSAHHPDWVQPYLAFGHELDFISSDGGFQVDLQWRFAKKWLSFPLDHEALWNRTTSVSVGGRSVRQLCPEDAMLMLCGHAYRHRWSCLKWISDVAAFMHAFEARLDWTRLVHEARNSGGMRVLGLGVWLAHAVGGAQVPPGVLVTVLNDRHTVALGRQVLTNLFAAQSAIGAHGSGGRLAQAAFQWRARERMQEKLPRLTPLIAHGQYVVHRLARHYAGPLFALCDRQVSRIV
ncbi:MAG: nucleotidyltransferase family protein [Betaproteobacteria bacterium]